MPRLGTAAALADLIDKMQVQRKEHLAAVAQIDALFERFGIHAPERRRGRKPAAMTGTVAPAGRRHRRKFKVSGNDLILAFVKERGKAVTSEITEHWRRNKRSGKADNPLSVMVKNGLLKRKKMAGERGSTYSLP